MAGFSNLIYEKQNNVLVLTLSRPERLNAISLQLLNEIGDALDKAAKDDEIKVVIITGQGKGFSAGADISDIRFDSMDEAEAFFRPIHTVFNRVEEFKKPTIAAINGLALGGGCEFSLCCDIRIASKNAAIGVPEITLGLLPGGGGTQRLPRLLGTSKALEMLFTGEPLSAEEAYRIGLVSKVVEPDKLMDEALALASKIAGKLPAACKTAKEVVKNGINMDLKSALEFEIQCLTPLCYLAYQSGSLDSFLKKGKSAK